LYTVADPIDSAFHRKIRGFSGERVDIESINAYRRRAQRALATRVLVIEHINDMNGLVNTEFLQCFRQHILRIFELRSACEI